MKNNNDFEFLEKLCQYCISNFQVINSSKLISSLIYQCGRILDMDLTAVEGILYVEINGYRRQYAHCFNIYNSNIIDASIYQFALMYMKVENNFPLYTNTNIPLHIEYKVLNEIKYDSQLKFNDGLLRKIIQEVAGFNNFSGNRFSLKDDSSKEDLFRLIIK